MPSPAPANPELESLLETKRSLEASIASRDAQAGQSDDHRRVTDTERARLREVEARLTELSPSSSSSSSSSSPA